MNAAARPIMSSVIAVVLATACLLPGCGMSARQKAAVIRFSEASIQLSEIASSEFIQTRNDVIEMNKLRNELAAASDLRSTLGTDALASKLTLEQTQIRLDTMEALRQYGKLLERLATSGDAGELKAATDSFLQALGGVEGIALDAGRSEALGALIEGVAGFIIEDMRYNAMKEVVEFADPHIRTIADLVRASFDPNDDRWLKQAIDTVTDLRAASVGCNGLLGNPQEEAAAKAAIRAQMEQAENLATQNERRFATISELIRRSCEDLRAAQNDLRTVMQAPDSTPQRLTEFVGHVRELTSAYRTLRGE